MEGFPNLRSRRNQIEAQIYICLLLLRVLRTAHRTVAESSAILLVRSRFPAHACIVHAAKAVVGVAPSTSVWFQAAEAICPWIMQELRKTPRLERARLAVAAK